MAGWEDFEVECYKYLRERYGSDSLKFIYKGKHNSNIPDVEIRYNNESMGYVEIKMPNAQCGQFVLQENNNTKEFIFSNQNKSDLNEYTQKIIDVMNNEYDYYSKPSLKFVDVQVSKNLAYDWIITKYTKQDVKFIITGNNDDFIIFPLDRFSSYFDVTTRYRTKRSGSQNPAKKYFNEIIKVVDGYGLHHGKIRTENKHVLIDLKVQDDKFILDGPQNRYQFKRLKGSGSEFIITQLSKTANKNVIFNIELFKENKAEKNKKDLMIFEEYLKKLERRI